MVLGCLERFEMGLEVRLWYNGMSDDSLAGYEGGNLPRFDASASARKRGMGRRPTKFRDHIVELGRF